MPSKPTARSAGRPGGRAVGVRPAAARGGAARAAMASAEASGQPGRGGAPAQDRELRAQGRQTMRRLLDAGRVVFEQRGFHAARVDDVVKRARTSHGTFYLYFANKEDLFRALAADALDEMAALADELGPIGGDARGRAALQAWFGRFLDVYAHHSTVVRAWTEGEIVDNDLGRQGSALLIRLSGALAERIAEVGTAPGVDPRIAALACLSMLERFTYLVQSRQISFDREDMLTTLGAVAHAGFFTGQPLPGGGRRARRS
ncbi:MAG: TetR/AcrR family transcriptional regulator [Mycobacteriales bacterium]